jgi:hypothetical protein
MAATSKIETELEELRQTLPEPFELSAKLDEFFTGPVAQRLIAGGKQTVDRLMSFLERTDEPALARVAVLLLSRFPTTEFYPKLMAILERTDQPMTEAFETGLWLQQRSEKDIAMDLVSLVAGSGNPNPLLLLQRPVAKDVRAELADFIKQHQMPLSLNALYAYRYALESNDVALMEEVAAWNEVPEMAALAGLYLLKLGSKNGLSGIRVGMISANEELRTIIYYQLSEFLPKQAFEDAGYNPAKPGDAQQTEVDLLIESLKQN